MSSFPEQLQEYALSEITRRIQTGEYPVGSRLVAKTISEYQRHACGGRH